MIRDTEPPPPPLTEPDNTFQATRLALMNADAPGAGVKVFVSTIVYSLARELGAAPAVEEVQRQLVAAAAASTPDQQALLAEYLPVVRAVTRLRGVFDVALHIDAGGTNIAKARSRAMHAFLQSDADVWVSIDDDVEADATTLAELVQAVQGTTVVCIAPCWLREQDRVNVMLDPLGETRELLGGSRVLAALAGGFGLVAMSKSAAHRFAGRYKDTLKFKDDDGQEKIAVFRDAIHQGQWFGEDMAFFLRTPPGVNVEALGTGRTVHAGRTLDLSSFETKRGLLRFGETEQEAPELTEPTPAVVDGPSAADLAPDPDPAPELHPAHAALLAAHREASEPPATVPPPTTPDGVNNPGEQKKPADAPSL